MARKKQQDLPGIEVGFPEIDEEALEIAGIDREGWEARRRRGRLVEDALKAMHEHGLTEYEVEGVHLKIKPGKDSLSVSVKKQEMPAEAEGEGEEGESGEAA